MAVDGHVPGNEDSVQVHASVRGGNPVRDSDLPYPIVVLSQVPRRSHPDLTLQSHDSGIVEGVELLDQLRDRAGRRHQLHAQVSEGRVLETGPYLDRLRKPYLRVQCEVAGHRRSVNIGARAISIVAPSPPSAVLTPFIGFLRWMRAKEGARHHGYTGQRGYHPLLAIAAGAGDVLMARLREGRANTARGTAHFLRETVGRVRYAGARGQLTVRADSGFYAHSVVSVCRKMDVRFSITLRQHASLRGLIEAIPEEDWTPIPYWMDGAADVAETTYTPFPVGPLRHLQLSRLHHRPGWGDARAGG